MLVHYRESRKFVMEKSASASFSANWMVAVAIGPSDWLMHTTEKYVILFSFHAKQWSRKIESTRQ